MKRKAIYTDEDTQRLIDNGQAWNFHGVYTQEHLHTLHPYPAKFIPQIPRKAITTWSKKGDLIYDPFCGCGTTLLEASLLERPSIGTDNNSVAILVSKAKVAKYTASVIKRLQALSSDLEDVLDQTTPRAELTPGSERIDYWFSRPVQKRLLTLKSFILSTREPLRTLLLAMFSSIIVKVSYQDSDTRYARIERDTAPSDVDRAFRKKLQEVAASLPEVIGSVRASSKAIQADARHVPFIRSDSVSLIITSPPYLNAYDYHKYHRQRIHWTDGSVEFARDQEIGSHDEFTRPNATPDAYFADMKECFLEWQRVLKQRGRCLVLIGDAIVSKKSVTVGDKYVALARAAGLRLEDRWIRELQSTKRAFNVRNSRISHEHVLLFQKL